MKDRIRELRKSLGMSQEVFAAELGATRGMIASYELGRVVPSDPMIELICTKFKVSKEWLLKGIGEMHDFQYDIEAANMAKYTTWYMATPEAVKAAIHVLCEEDPKYTLMINEFLLKIIEEMQK